MVAKYRNFTETEKEKVKPKKKILEVFVFN